jgi:BetI-type transcriptional repressor, C-terminal
VFVAVESRLSQTRCSPLRILRVGGLAGSSVVRGFVGTGMYSTFLLGVLYLQHVHGYGALQTGLAFLPLTLMIGLFSLGVTARLMRQFGATRVVLPEAVEAELAAGVPPVEAPRRSVSVLRGERDAFLLLIDFWGEAVRDRTAAERFVQRHARLQATIEQLLKAAVPERDTRHGLPTDQLATTLIALANGFAIELLSNPDAVHDDLFGYAIGALVQGSR